MTPTPTPSSSPALDDTTSDELAAAHDVVVVGGGPAGLNGALMLARMRASVAVIDSGTPRNAPAEQAHGMLGHDGIPPLDLLRRGRAEVRRYGGRIVTADVARIEPVGTADEPHFSVHLADGRRCTARRILVATGLVDDLPAIPGLRERWGRDVVHCPFCHGWEVRDRHIGVLATGPMTTHQALLLRRLSSQVEVIRGDVEIGADDRRLLAAAQVPVVEGSVGRVLVEDDALVGVELTDGRHLDLGAMAVASRLRTRAASLAGLGLHAVPHPTGMGSFVATDATGRTEVAGVWAAGNATDLFAQVGASAAAGAAAPRSSRT